MKKYTVKKTNRVVHTGAYVKAAYQLSADRPSMKSFYFGRNRGKKSARRFKFMLYEHHSRVRELAIEFLEKGYGRKKPARKPSDTPQAKWFEGQNRTAGSYGFRESPLSPAGQQSENGVAPRPAALPCQFAGADRYA